MLHIDIAQINFNSQTQQNSFKMAQSNNIDYVHTYFECPVLTNIHRQLNCVNLKIIKDVMKSNTVAVSSNLGGGVNGHLEIITTNAEYVMVLPIPYVQPVHPGALTLPAGVGVTYLQIEITRDQHNEKIRAFKEVVNIEQALLKKIVQAVPEIYLKSF